MAIFTAVDIILIFLFFPETQYYRKPTYDLVAANISTEKQPETTVTEESGSTEATPPPPKKSFLQQMKPWSGINPGSEKNTNFFFLFIRPWPMVVYPAVIYAFVVFSTNLACLLNVV